MTSALANAPCLNGFVDCQQTHRHRSQNLWAASLARAQHATRQAPRLTDATRHAIHLVAFTRLLLLTQSHWLWVARVSSVSTANVHFAIRATPPQRDTAMTMTTKARARLVNDLKCVTRLLLRWRSLTSTSPNWLAGLDALLRDRWHAFAGAANCMLSGRTCRRSSCVACGDFESARQRTEWRGGGRRKGVACCTAGKALAASRRAENHSLKQVQINMANVSNATG
jgi:hypothetical protein